MSFNEKKLYEDYVDKVYKAIYYIVKNREMAKDATQETFIKVFENVNKMNDLSKITSWIMTIATRTAIDFYNQKRKQMVLEFDESKYSGKANELNEEIDELAMYLNNLKPEQRQILILKYIEAFSEKEIAKHLKIKVGTVKSRLFRAKKKLLDEYQSGGVENG